MEGGKAATPRPRLEKAERRPGHCLHILQGTRAQPDPLQKMARFPGQNTRRTHSIQVFGRSMSLLANAAFFPIPRHPCPPAWLFRYSCCVDAQQNGSRRVLHLPTLHCPPCFSATLLPTGKTLSRVCPVQSLDGSISLAAKWMSQSLSLEISSFKLNIYLPGLTELISSA